MDPLRGGIGVAQSFLQGGRHGRHPQHPAAACHQQAVFQPVPRVVDGDVFRQGGGDGDGLALLIVAGVAAGGQNDAGGGAAVPLHLEVPQRFVFHRLHHGEQVGLEQGEHHLGLRVPEAAVVLNDLGALGGEHQPEVEAALEGAALGPHGRQGGEKDFLHALRRHSGGVIGVGSHGAHAPGIGPGVAVQGPLVIHGGYHGGDVGAVGKGQDTDLRPGEKLLHHDLAARVAKGPILHDGLDGGPGLLHALGNEDPLAQSQAVGLDDGGVGGGLQVGHGLRRVRKHPVVRRGDAVFLHQALGKDLAGLDAGGVSAGAKAGDACRVEGVHAAQGQGVVRGHHREVHRVGRGKVYNGRDVLGPDLRDAHRVGRNAAVAGETVDGLHGSVFLQLFDDGVFAAAAADD